MAGSLTHLDYLESVCADDVGEVQVKDREYGASWKRRGGVGAFMMLARKWDRLEAALAPANDTDATHISRMSHRSPEGHLVAPWDILGAMEADDRDEGILDDIRDLRRYLLLVEAEHRRRQAVGRVTVQNAPDGMEHPRGYDGDG